MFILTFNMNMHKAMGCGAAPSNEYRCQDITSASALCWIICCLLCVFLNYIFFSFIHCSVILEFRLLFFLTALRFSLRLYSRLLTFLLHSVSPSSRPLPPVPSQYSAQVSPLAHQPVVFHSSAEHWLFLCLSLALVSPHAPCDPPQL